MPASKVVLALEVAFEVLLASEVARASWPVGPAPGAALARINSHKAIGGAKSQFDFGPLFAQLDRQLAQRRVQLIAHLAVLFAVNRYGAFSEFAVGFASG